MPRESEEVEVQPWEVLQDDIVNLAGRMLAIDSINMTSPSEYTPLFRDGSPYPDGRSRMVIKNLEFTFLCRSGETFSVPGHELMTVRRFAVPGNRGRSGETGELTSTREDWDRLKPGQTFGDVSHG